MESVPVEDAPSLALGQGETSAKWSPSHWLRRAWTGMPAGLAFAGCSGALALHIRHYWPYLSDDALISLRYSQRLATGHGLTWTDGERVEGYTNLLWVLFNTPGVWFGVDPIVSARVLGVVGVLLAVAALGFSPQTGRWTATRLVAGGGLLVASASTAVWAIGGLEQGMLVGVVAVALAALARAISAGVTPRLVAIGGGALAAVALLRADGILVVAALLLATWAVGFPDRGRWLGVLKLGAPAALAFALQLVFRLLYYGEWWPNSAIAKVAITADRWTRGLQYLVAGTEAYPVVLGLACLGTALALEHRPRGRLAPAWGLAITWPVYVAAMGGDVFPAHRSLIVVLLSACWLVAEGAEALHALLGQRILVAAASLIPLGAWHLKIQNSDPGSEHAHADNWEFAGLAIGGVFKTAFAARAPLFAMDAAGALAYASELPALDLLGINDRHIGHHRTAAFGHSAPGHELGDGAYVLGRHPDLVTFGCAGGTHAPVFISGYELVALPEFQRDYQWIRVGSGPPDVAYGEVWVRREGGKVGIVRDADRVEVPGYLFTGELSVAVSRLTADGVLAAQVPPTAPGRIAGLELPAGRWRVEVEAEGAPARLFFKCGEQPMRRIGRRAANVLDLTHPSTLEVVSIPPGEAGGLVLRRVVFVRDSAATPTYDCLPSRPMSGPPAVPNPQGTGP